MINAEKITTVVLDLDKTLLHTDKTLSEYTIEILNECKKKGMQILMATARPLRTTKQYCEKIDFDAMAVSNGARVICGNRQTDYGICKKSAVRLLNTLLRHPSLRITLETGECAYSNKPIEDYETILTDDLVGIANKEGALKILVHLDSEDTLPLVEKELNEDLYYTVANGYLLQIMDIRATKWNGVKAMLEICGSSPEAAAYFGDDQDDLEPIRMCGLGIAVSNGIEEVKAAADHIAESNNSDGVARFIEQSLLKIQ